MKRKTSLVVAITNAMKKIGRGRTAGKKDYGDMDQTQDHSRLLDRGKLLQPGGAEMASLFITHGPDEEEPFPVSDFLRRWITEGEAGMIARYAELWAGLLPNDPEQAAAIIQATIERYEVLTKRRALMDKIGGAEPD